MVSINLNLLQNRETRDITCAADNPSDDTNKGRNI